MSAITLALDFGGSGLRGIMTQEESFKPELFLMQPEVTLVTRESLEDYSNFRIGSSAPSMSAWVEYKGEFYAVGNLATRFKANLQLGKRKFELALPKVLAAVGAISETYKLANGTRINLGAVLPYGEFGDRDLFGQILSEALADFKFCGVEKSFSLDTFICLPEGGGVLTQGRPPGSSFRDLELIVLMLGFRDVSLLFVNKGEMADGVSEPFGFSNLISSVGKKTAIRDYHKLTAAICKAGRNINQRALQPLLNNVGDTYKEYQLAKITKAITEAKAQYWLMLSEWLKGQIKDQVDEIIVAGGTAQFLRPELNSLLGFTKVVWCDELEKRINASFSDQIKANSLQYRLGDVYGLFFYLHSRTVKTLAKTHE